MNHALLSFLICAAAAVLEGIAAGGGVRERFHEIRLPRFSPPLALWVGIGLVYYVMNFAILVRLLRVSPHTTEWVATLALSLAMLVYNAGWGVLFFRVKHLRASYLAFFPYGVLVIALTVLLARLDSVAALILLPYLAYLIYASWWGRAVWRLNADHTPITR